jgi:hypothetical protein
VIPSPLRATSQTPDGGAVIAPADLPALRRALADAIAIRGRAVGFCRSCRPGKPCETHAEDAGQAEAYRSLAESLGLRGPARQRGAAL